MKVLFTVLVVLATMGCTPAPLKIVPKSAKALIEAIHFEKHPNGMCFGILESLRFNSAGHASSSVSITQVDCKSAGL